MQKVSIFQILTKPFIHFVILLPVCFSIVLMCFSKYASKACVSLSSYFTSNNWSWSLR